MSRLTTPRIYGSVGKDGLNQTGDVRTVQELLNEKRPLPLLRLDENGDCNQTTIDAIVQYQSQILHLAKADGYVDPDSRTFRSLAAEPPPRPQDIPIAPSIGKPSNMREGAWRYVLHFTKKHEGMVLHMYNNRKADSTKQDVTCGIGFLIDPRSAATEGTLKAMFIDPNGNQVIDAEMLADWDEAAKLARTADNLDEYAKVCHLRMKPELVYNHMAIILKDQKLPALLSQCKDDFADFANFPAAAQVFSLSFAYGRIPLDFPMMRESIRNKRWAEAADRCHVTGQNESKNAAHAALLRFAQKIQDAKGDFDELPSTVL